MSSRQLSIKGTILWSSPQEFFGESISLAKGKKVLLVMNATTA